MMKKMKKCSKCNLNMIELKDNTRRYKYNYYKCSKCNDEILTMEQLSRINK
jgi:DNA-directed RNA polymerase subunit RPC12/RpoP